jgi:DUF4097 and DUF4098 domain-containing protein YvlB
MQMPRPLALLTAAVLAAGTLPAALGAQRTRDRDRDEDEDRATSRIDTVVAFNRGGVVDLSLVSGEIVVTGWDRNEARVNAYSESGILRLDASAARISLDVDRQHGSGDTRFEVAVPAGSRVLLHSTSGDLDARGVRGEVEMRTVSGDVQVEDAGPLTFESVSGDVTAKRIVGGARGNTVSGEIGIDDVSGDVDVQTTSGDIDLGGAKSKFVQAESVSGELTYDGTIDPSGRYEFHSHSGEIRLRLPTNAGARLGVETFSGEIDSDFPLTVTPDRSSRERPMRMEFTLGSGGARITAQTFSGNVTLERAGAARPKERE